MSINNKSKRIRLPNGQYSRTFTYYERRDICDAYIGGVTLSTLCRMYQTTRPTLEKLLLCYNIKLPKKPTIVFDYLAYIELMREPGCEIRTSTQS